MKPITPDAMQAIERHFHDVIRQRARHLLEQSPSLQLPTIDDTTPSSKEKSAWFPVPGMYGGFAYWFDHAGDRPKLISESWCRVVGGSGERHEIDAEGSNISRARFCLIQRPNHPMVRRGDMRPSLPSAFVLTATDATALASEFTRLAQNVDLCAVESLLPSLSTESGCYLWLLCHEGSQFKVYLGRARSIRKRIKDYGLDFQVHSPNDFKLRLFYSFMAEWWPGSTLDLYFAACPADDLGGRERDLIRQFRPLINDIPAPSDEERRIVHDAFRAYYRSVLDRHLGTPNSL